MILPDFCPVMSNLCFLHSRGGESRFWGCGGLGAIARSKRHAHRSHLCCAHFGVSPAPQSPIPHPSRKNFSEDATIVMDSPRCWCCGASMQNKSLITSIALYYGQSTSTAGGILLSPHTSHLDLSLPCRSGDQVEFERGQNARTIPPNSLRRPGKQCKHDQVSQP